MSVVENEVLLTANKDALASKDSQKHIRPSKPSRSGDPLRQFVLVELVCRSL